LVTSEGTISSAAACAGGIHNASNAMDSVGSPSPISPLTAPASANTATAAATAPPFCEDSSFSMHLLSVHDPRGILCGPGAASKAESPQRPSGTA